MRVSVPMLTYNHEKYIAQAIEGVLNQQVNFEYEIVIGEDCSTDKTREIVVDFQKRHPERIRLLLPEKNLGPMKNLLQTFDACKGEYLAGVEGDDYWTSPDKLQKQVDYLDSHPECALCHHNVIELYENGGREPHPHHPPGQKEVSTLDDLWEMNFMATCSVMLRRDPVNKLPKWFMKLPWGDWALFVLAARRGTIGYLDEVMGVHRVHNAGMWSGSNNIERYRRVIKFYKEIDKGLELAYHERIRGRIAEEHYYLALEYQRMGDLVNASKCAVRSFLEDPHCQRVPRGDLYKAIARIHKAILRQHVPTLYRMLAAVRRALSHRVSTGNGTEGNAPSGKRNTHV
jgi:glycosyltransferase involved in cell wall biosynthesis